MITSRVAAFQGKACLCIPIQDKMSTIGPNSGVDLERRM